MVARVTLEVLLWDLPQALETRVSLVIPVIAVIRDRQFTIHHFHQTRPLIHRLRPLIRPLPRRPLIRRPPHQRQIRLPVTPVIVSIVGTACLRSETGAVIPVVATQAIMADDLITRTSLEDRTPREYGNSDLRAVVSRLCEADEPLSKTQAVLLYGSQVKLPNNRRDVDLLVVSAADQFQKFHIFEGLLFDLYVANWEHYHLRLHQNRRDNNNFILNALATSRVLCDPQGLGGSLIRIAREVITTLPQDMTAQDAATEWRALSRLKNTAHKHLIAGATSASHSAVARMKIDLIARSALEVWARVERWRNSGLLSIVERCRECNNGLDVLWDSYCSKSSDWDRFDCACSMLNVVLPALEALCARAN